MAYPQDKRLQLSTNLSRAGEEKLTRKKYLPSKVRTSRWSRFSWSCIVLTQRFYQLIQTSSMAGIVVIKFRHVVRKGPSVTGTISKITARIQWHPNVETWLGVFWYFNLIDRVQRIVDKRIEARIIRTKILDGMLKRKKYRISQLINI